MFTIIYETITTDCHLFLFLSSLFPFSFFSFFFSCIILRGLLKRQARSTCSKCSKCSYANPVLYTDIAITDIVYSYYYHRHCIQLLLSQTLYTDIVYRDRDRQTLCTDIVYGLLSIYVFLLILLHTLSPNILSGFFPALYMAIGIPVIVTYTYTYSHPYIHIHILTPVHTHAHTHTRTYTDTYSHPYIHIHTHTYIHIHILTPVHTHTHTHTRTYTYIHTGTYTDTYSHPYIHIHILTPVYTHTYTHVHTLNTYIYTHTPMV